MSKETILDVDDEEDIRKLVEYNLAKEGYHVLCAATGEAGLSMAKTKQPDLVVLDLMLPGMDGLEVCKTLKANSKTCQSPVLMLTAKVEDSNIVTGLEVGADDYIANHSVQKCWSPVFARLFVARQFRFLKNRPRLGIMIS